MTPRAPRRRCSDPGEPLAEALGRDPHLAMIGVARGDRVRFRRRDSERWKDGVVVRRETDGSLGVRDQKGALRALPLHLVEVRDRGPRGGVVWEPLPERAARTEQLDLFEP
ncbi:hypothetical protein [Rhabdothermincola salaria]|uniref:hypothetical protein n=1 Tax=Rhabdothermincola salaria TaxID=2903142 RepID=UPI001E340B3A|nr:hypothetical protein [Rhabdothermincola salaria]MCD9623565.1 hypothetical protein [Rhabdothermincola salaria]